MENLVVNIKNIHVRYEDRLSHADPFCLGFMIRDISVYTTNSHGKKIFVEAAQDNDEEFSTSDGHAKQTNLKVVSTHKRAHVEGFAIYWSTADKFKSFASLSTPQWRDQMQASFNDNSNDNDCPQEVYIVPPMDTYVRVVRHTHIDSIDDRIKKRETYEVSLNLDRVCVNLSTDQYSDLLAIFENQKRRNIKREKFRSIFLQQQSVLYPLQKQHSEDSSYTHQRYITLYNTQNKTKNVEKELRHMERDILDTNTIIRLRNEADEINTSTKSPADTSALVDGGYGFGDFMDVLFGSSEETKKV